MTYPLSATQLESVLLLVQALNSASKDLDIILEGDEDKQLGEGHLAILESPIRIISDVSGGFAGSEPEVFGWVVEDEHGWDFTQIDPTKK